MLPKKLGRAAFSLALFGLLLSGCGGQLAGSAAVIGEERITEKYLVTQLDELKVALGLEASTPLGEQAARAILARAIVDLVIREAASAEEISVSESAVAEERGVLEETFGGEDSLIEYAANQGLPPAMINDALRTNLLLIALGQKLSPGVEPALQQEVASSYVAEFANSLGVQVSPRIGVWVPENLSIAPPPDDLSVPASQLQTN